MLSQGGRGRSEKDSMTRRGAGARAAFANRDRGRCPTSSALRLREQARGTIDADGMKARPFATVRSWKVSAGRWDEEECGGGERLVVRLPDGNWNCGKWAFHGGGTVRPRT